MATYSSQDHISHILSRGIFKLTRERSARAILEYAGFFTTIVRQDREPLIPDGFCCIREAGETGFFDRSSSSC